jgi:hypothetical protein
MGILTTLKPLPFKLTVSFVKSIKTDEIGHVPMTALLIYRKAILAPSRSDRFNVDYERVLYRDTI